MHAETLFEGRVLTAEVDSVVSREDGCAIAGGALAGGEVARHARKSTLLQLRFDILICCDHRGRSRSFFRKRSEGVPAAAIEGERALCIRYGEQLSAIRRVKSVAYRDTCARRVVGEYHQSTRRDWNARVRDHRVDARYRVVLMVRRAHERRKLRGDVEQMRLRRYTPGGIRLSGAGGGNRAAPSRALLQPSRIYRERECASECVGQGCLHGR